MDDNSGSNENVSTENSSSTENQSNENQTQTYSENSSLNNLTMEKQQLRLIQMNQIIVQTN